MVNKFKKQVPVKVLIKVFLKKFIYTDSLFTTLVVILLSNFLTYRVFAKYIDNFY